MMLHGLEKKIARQEMFLAGDFIINGLHQNL